LEQFNQYRKKKVNKKSKFQGMFKNVIAKSLPLGKVVDVQEMRDKVTGAFQCLTVSVSSAT
jgi:hypothetical protein